MRVKGLVQRLDYEWLRTKYGLITDKAIIIIMMIVELSLTRWGQYGYNSDDNNVFLRVLEVSRFLL